MTNRYKKTFGEIKRGIAENFPDAQPMESIGEEPSYTLWMIERTEHELQNQGKVDLWSGWIFKSAYDLGVLTLRQIRDLVHEDIYPPLTEAEKLPYDPFAEE